MADAKNATPTLNLVAIDVGRYWNALLNRIAGRQAVSDSQGTIVGKELTLQSSGTADGDLCQ